MPHLKCGHHNLAPYGCENCFMSHEDIAAERAALRDAVGILGVNSVLIEHAAPENAKMLMRAAKYLIK